MDNLISGIMESKFTPEHQAMLKKCPSSILCQIAQYAEKAEPDSIYLSDGSRADQQRIRTEALLQAEEQKLAQTGQTIHFDGYHDQGQDKKNLFVVNPDPQNDIPPNLNILSPENFESESEKLISKCMSGRQAILSFYCLGPDSGPFTQICIQLTDSFYLCHSQNILYRPFFPDFESKFYKKQPYFFFHSKGHLTQEGFSSHLKNRRIFIDPPGRAVVALNTQFAGNAGLKNNAIRLSIYDGIRNGWLCAHMCLLGVPTGDNQPITYFAGAFLPGCGLRETYAQPEYLFAGDHVVYIHNIQGQARVVNPERGLFGILQDTAIQSHSPVSSVFNEDQEIIFSNILVGPDNRPYWPGMKSPAPSEGINHSGPDWHPGKTDGKGQAIPMGHPNGRFATSLAHVANHRSSTEKPEGWPLHALLFGCRDSDTSVPVEQSANWKNGILLKGCTLETESTSATLKREGLWFPNIMANADYIPTSASRFIKHILSVGESFSNAPVIFTVNYFLKDFTGEYCNSQKAKKVWLHWAAMRVQGRCEAHPTPLGYIPLYDDLVPLFANLIDESYNRDDYLQQFKFRCTHWVKKIHRIHNYFQSMPLPFPPNISEYWEHALHTLSDIQNAQGTTIPPGEYQGQPIH